MKVCFHLIKVCGLSPILFIMYLDKIIQEWKLTNLPGIKLDINILLQTLIFADGQLLLAKSQDDSQRSVHKPQPILTKYNMKILETK